MDQYVCVCHTQSSSRNVNLGSCDKDPVQKEVAEGRGQEGRWEATSQIKVLPALREIELQVALQGCLQKTY